jgi:ADP-ribose pyrophosphatase
LEEEAGVRAGQLELLTTVYTTPGFTDERIHLFLASGLTPGTHAREADEFVEVLPTPWSEVRRMIQRREIIDAKTLVALCYGAMFAGIGTR